MPKHVRRSYAPQPSHTQQKPQNDVPPQPSPTKEVPVVKQELVHHEHAIKNMPVSDVAKKSDLYIGIGIGSGIFIIIMLILFYILNSKRRSPISYFF